MDGATGTQGDVLTVEADLPLLADLLEGAAQSSPEFRRRNSPFNYKSVHRADTAEAIEEGWEVARRGKRQHRLKQPKPRNQALEDRVWCLLYRMGYADLGAKRLSIKFKRDNGAEGTKQIDVFAADGETAIVVECKSREERGRRVLSKDIAETRSLQNFIRGVIHKKYASKPKVIWLYVTNNIIWSESDVERAESAGVYIVTENELSYFETFIGHMGPAGRYQILGEFLRDQKIPGIPTQTVPAIRGKLGGEVFYSFVTTPRNLLRIAFVNHQALNHPDGSPAYQRMISPGRVKAIGEFIKSGGFFPTNILLNFVDSPKFSLLDNSLNTDPTAKFGWLTLPSKYRSAWVIDGQHRLYGFSGLDEKYLDQNITVIAFSGLAKVKEADLFITINHKQKSVPKGLLVALLADLKMGDADPKTALSALASAVVRTLNADKTSPFFQRFRMPDVPPSHQQNLTISEAVNGLNRAALLGKVMHKAIAPAAFSAANDVATIERARRILNGYFEAIASAHPARWAAGASAYICVNPGLRAHLMLLPEIMGYISSKKGVDFASISDEEVISEINAVSEPICDFVRTATDEQIREAFSRRFGEGGVKDYLHKLCEIISKRHEDFGSDEFKRALEQRASDTITEASKDIMYISELLTDVVLKTLKSVHGSQVLDSGDAAYWEVGIAKTTIKEKAYKRQQEEPQERRKRKEAYLDLIDMKEIVEQANNWPHFQSTFNLASPGEKRGGKYTGWMARFNDIRKIAAHKNSLRTYTDEDLAFLDWVRAEALPRLLTAGEAL